MNSHVATLWGSTRGLTKVVGAARSAVKRCVRAPVRVLHENTSHKHIKEAKAHQLWVVHNLHNVFKDRTEMS